MSAGPLLGRAEELVAIDEFLDGVGNGFAVLALEGEPGIGKTTLWQEAVRRAEAQGASVLSCRPAAAEARLALAALGDLLAPVQAEQFAGLPEPQRRALEIALLRAAAEGPPPDRRTICVAFLSLLRQLAAARPVVVAVDDAQWLDPESGAVLEFAKHRLLAERVRMLTSSRLSDLAPSTNNAALRLGPLSLGTLHELIRQRLGRSFARPDLLKIERTAHGNPFFTLEIARALLHRGEPRAGDPLPIPDDLRALLRTRIGLLPSSSREALLVASALSTPTVGLVDVTALAPAEEADVVRVTTGGRVEFTHPLLAAAVYASAPTGTRLALHRRLAELVDSDEERARHLALGATEPDERVAVALEAAARSAAARGAPTAAAELAELAIRLTPSADVDSRRARTLELAHHYLGAGDPSRARDLLAGLVQETLAGPLRGRAQLLLAEIDESGHSPEAATALCERALEEADGDVELCAGLHAFASRSADHDTPRKLRHAQAALALLDSTDLPQRLSVATLLAVAEARFNAGAGLDHDIVRRVQELERGAPSGSVTRGDRFVTNVALFTGDYGAARHGYERLRCHDADRGDEVRLARLAHRMALLELHTGNWHAADGYLHELDSLVGRTGQEILRQRSTLVQARLHALRGRLDAARAAAEEGLALAIALGARLDAGLTHAALGFVELSAGDLSAAAAHLELADETYRSAGLGEPRLFRHQPDHVEALAGLGELAAAEQALARFELQGRNPAKPWVIATAARCHGLLRAAEGDLEGAVEQLDVSLAHEISEPFEHARSLLALGRIQRRRKQRKVARDALEAARTTFEALGAPLWETQAQAELDRTHLREAPRDLTPTEEQVARFAAEGLKNREIAARLFVSPKTVETNLARAYRKLGVASRAELGAVMGDRPKASS